MIILYYEASLEKSQQLLDLPTGPHNIRPNFARQIREEPLASVDAEIGGRLCLRCRCPLLFF